MFGFLKSQGTKTADTVAGIFRPAFHGVKLTNGGDIPASVKNDDFLVGYMFGAFNLATKLSGVTNNMNVLTATHAFFQHFFPQDYSEMTKLCLDKYASSEVFKSAAKLGAEEFQKMTAGMGQLESFTEHVAKNYW